MVNKKDIIVYSCNLGNYDRLSEPLFNDLKVHFILFTDNLKLKSKIWDIRYIKPNYINKDKQRVCRYIKTNPHNFLPNHKINIWVDSSFLLKVINYEQLIKFNLYNKEKIVAYEHGSENDYRRCLYEEAEILLKREDLNKNLILEQINRYKREGFPSNFGLFSTGFLIRRNDTKTNNFNDFWWNEILNGSKRDQLSFTYCSWKLNFEIGKMKIGQNIYNNPYLRKFKHLNKLKKQKMIYHNLSF